VASGQESSRELDTDLLDILALLLLAAGVVSGLWPLIAGWSVACGGGVVFIGVRLIDWSRNADDKAKRGEPT
jgi:F0F1-type ATP synthase assembly protein I